MSETSKDNDGAGASGRERRRFPRYEHRIQVTFTFDGEESQAHTLDVSKTGARFVSDNIPDSESRLLLRLLDRQNPSLCVYLKVKVVRVENDPDGLASFGVEFGDAVARDPRILREFLERVLQINAGLIQVIEPDPGGSKAFAFSFDPVHKEGDERLRALTSSLFSSLEEMDEADLLLENFGREPQPLDPGAGPAQSAGENTGGALHNGPQATDLSALDPAAIPLDRSVREVEEPEGEKAPTPAASKGLLGKLGSLFGSRKTDGKGGRLVQVNPLPNIVARDVSLPVVYRLGTTRYQGKATRLYCAGLKIYSNEKLPSLYAGITVMIPLAGARKISQIELVGDVTRVRPDAPDDPESPGVFEVRASMRTDKIHLEMYRFLLEKLTENK